MRRGEQLAPPRAAERHALQRVQGSTRPTGMLPASLTNFTNEGRGMQQDPASGASPDPVAPAILLASATPGRRDAERAGTGLEAIRRDVFGDPPDPGASRGRVARLGAT